MSFRPIFGIPRLTQDWGTEQHERETHWTSLFYDLMVVAALNAIAEPFEEPTEAADRRVLLEEEKDSSPFVLTPIQHLWLDAILQFSSVVTPWNFLNDFTSKMEDESFVGHISFFVHAFGLAATTAGCVGELSENYRVLGTGNVLAKLGLLVLYSRPIWYIPRTRIHFFMRGACQIVNVLLVLVGMQYDFVIFRKFLVASTLWDWLAILLHVLLKKKQRIPVHIQSYSDRIKEVTMVIFGEAIFSIILMPHSQAPSQTHFYVALWSTLWLIYSMALQEFHILPNEDDHALRRSRLFGLSWYYTQFFKQVCLLATSVGIKRAHLLMFKAPTQSVDLDTRRLIVWGLSLTMMSVTLIRAYSFGFGRNPSKDDPPELYRAKVSWWVCMAVLIVTPLVVNATILEHFSSRPLFVMIVLGSVMSLAIMVEAAISYMVAEHLKKFMQAHGGDVEPGEMTYLHSTSSIRTASSEQSSIDNLQGESVPRRRSSSFPVALCPKAVS